MFFSKPKGFTLIELLVVIVIIGILAAIALPNYIKVKEKAKEAEVKSNLHNIQLSIERFAVDTEGAYPNYLIGGEAKYADQVNTGASANAFLNITVCDPTEGVSDPLLRKGYVDSYPRNPFTRNGISVHQLQNNLSTAQATVGSFSISGSDPLRNGDGEWNSTQIALGTRFGSYCTTMGSVLAEPRFALWVYPHPQDGTYEERPTFANVEYRFWDMWRSNKPLPFLPGQFFFKGAGPIVAVGTETAQNEPILPTEIDQYVLGGYGGIRTKGKDPLGEEAQIQYTTGNASGRNWIAGAGENVLRQPPPPPGGGGGNVGDLQIWPWTRSQTAVDSLMGSPYSPAKVGDSNEQLMYGNPNAVRDGIVIVLTAGEDYIGDR